MNDDIPMVRITAEMPVELKNNLKAELAREGSDITEFINIEAIRYLETKQVRLPKRGNKRKAS